ncbi:MAG TPA: 2-succinyl-5-enolpyruvyl-6-hydroxy-3-cyclohexene-1-carboxylic-acid synthase [Longimicrobiales bacterium]|nr:2-succinyl-5-enolpyruvyl-6-hydroxy-3-cyclohexene-1-carboxylic-acid synthase [Longimicrobiales bacterium]
MSSAEATTLWARAFTDELARCGVREVVVAPGSRSTPLVLAFAADDRFRTRVHLDERSAGFFALGVGRASGVPAVVLTTSGTATANLFPAVMEASQGEVPLLVLTADRPHRLRDADANQAVDQLRLFGPFARAFFEAAPPTPEGPALHHLRALAARAVLGTREAPAGPVHVNFPFDKPLEPAPDPPDGTLFAAQHPLATGGRPQGRPFVDVAPGRRLPGAGDVARLTDLIGRARRPVLVAGPDATPGRAGPAALALAARTGIPLLSDPLSGARFGPCGEALVVAGYDLFLREEQVRRRLAPDLILRVGASPTSVALQGWMEHHQGVRHVVIDAGGRWKDHGALATDYVRADATEAMKAVTEVAESSLDPAWRSAWETASTAARLALAQQAAGNDHEGRILADVVETLPAGSSLFVSSSMPVRDLDAFGRPRDVRLDVWANRGASGIDGILSSAFGVAAASPGPTVCVLGDVAFFHDQNGLLWSREGDAAVVFVLIDNDGGGIFHMLPVRDHEPHFTRFFATPHGLDFHHAARMHGVPFREVEGARLVEALGEALEAGGTHVLRVRTDRVRAQARRREIAEAVAGSVRIALG